MLLSQRPIRHTNGTVLQEADNNVSGMVQRKAGAAPSGDICDGLSGFGTHDYAALSHREDTHHQPRTLYTGGRRRAVQWEGARGVAGFYQLHGPTSE